MFISLFAFNQEFDRRATEVELGRHLDEDGNNGAVECDACIDDVTDEDFICWITEKKGKKEEEFTLTMTDKDWIRELCEWADATRTRDLPFLSFPFLAETRFDWEGEDRGCHSESFLRSSLANQPRYRQLFSIFRRYRPMILVASVAKMILK